MANLLRMLVGLTFVFITVQASASAGNSPWRFLLATGKSNVTADTGTASAGVNQQTLSIDESDTSFRASLKYLIDDNWYVNFGYVDLGEASITLSSDTLDKEVLTQQLSGIGPYLASGFTAGGAYRYWFEQLAVEANFGVFSWQSDIKSSSGNSNILVEKSGSDVYFAIGTLYQFSNEFSLGASWQRYRLEGNDVDNIDLSFTYAF